METLTIVWWYILDYAFVHFKQRDDARKAMEVLNGLNLEGQCIEICLAKPQDKKLKEKKLERQMQKQMALRWVNSFKNLQEP